MSESIEVVEKEQEGWIAKKWRPAMAWLYMVTCAFDFIVAPIAMAIIQTMADQTITPWQPLTLQGAGLYHLAMGAIVGITSWARGQERITEMNAMSQMSRTIESRNNPVNRIRTPRYTISRQAIQPSGTDLLDADALPPRVDPEARSVG